MRRQEISELAHGNSPTPWMMAHGKEGAWGRAVWGLERWGQKGTITCKHAGHYMQDHVKMGQMGLGAGRRGTRKNKAGLTSRLHSLGQSAEFESKSSRFKTRALPLRCPVALPGKLGSAPKQGPDLGLLWMEEKRERS